MDLIKHPGVSIESLSDKLETYLNRVNEFVIDSTETSRQVNDLIIAARIAAERLEQDKEERLRHHKEQVRILTDMYERPLSMFRSIKSTAQSKITKYMTALETEAVSKATDALDIPPPARVQSDYGTTTQKWVKRVKIHNIKEVPRELLEQCIDEPKLKRLILDWFKAKRTIAGTEVCEEPVTVTRSNL